MMVGAGGLALSVQSLGRSLKLGTLDHACFVFFDCEIVGNIWHV